MNIWKKPSFTAWEMYLYEVAQHTHVHALQSNDGKRRGFFFSFSVCAVETLTVSVFSPFPPQTVKQMWPYICQFVEKLFHETIEPAVKESNSHLSTFCFSKIDIGDKVSPSRFDHVLFQQWQNRLLAAGAVGTAGENVNVHMHVADIYACFINSFHAGSGEGSTLW